MAKTLTNLEAIVGQMYPSIFIARLVSLYVSQDRGRWLAFDEGIADKNTHRKGL